MTREDLEVAKERWHWEPAYGWVNQDDYAASIHEQRMLHEIQRLRRLTRSLQHQLKLKERRKK